MATMVHFIDVGQGNMVLVQCSDGTNFMVDCNITDANKGRVLAYIANQIGRAGRLRAFICTHRDADHMRGVRTLHNSFPIGAVWDSGYPGTTTNTDEYLEYMRLRRDVGEWVIKKQTRYDYGYTRLRFLSAKDSRLPDNANDQGLVIKVEEQNLGKTRAVGSAMLTGDGGSAVWAKGIMRDYAVSELSCSILMAAHHGSDTFFESSGSSYYTAHIEAMKPDMTVISVGPNNYGHPDATALRLYERFSKGSNRGNKVIRTDQKGTIKLELKAGGWNLNSSR